jgi:outer membrane receptor protein involved in Fe transport
MIDSVRPGQHQRREFMKTTILTVAALLASTALCGFVAPACAADQTTAQKAAKKDSAEEPKDIIVTGVFKATAIERTPISINVVTAAQISEHAAVSAADLLKNVPGVFVNSSLGEIRNVVFSRGVSANSLDAAGGYYYVSLQEDGLPTELVTATNFGPDYFLRPDLNLSRLEALRGGTASITGPNAPGGIFNYISKTGKSNPGVEMQGKFGLEGNGQNPYYRADFYAGGKLTDNMYYSVGGFYRVDRGAHNPGYSHNKGGQIHGNILYDYDQGSVLFTAKYLDDHNGWFEFTPAIGGSATYPSGFGATSSVLPPAAGAHSFPVVGGGSETWDPTNLVHSRSLSAGMNWKHNLSSDVHFENKLRYSHNTADWNTGAVISVVPFTDVVASFIDGTANLPAGNFTYKFHGTNTVAATAFSFIPGPGAPAIKVPTSNNLPNQAIQANGVFTQAAFVQHFKADEFVDQATLTADLGDHHLAVGGYLAIARLNQLGEGGGFGYSTLTNQPQMLDITYTPNGGTTTYQVTDPSGFTAEGQPIGSSFQGKQNQYSVFFGDTWKVTPQLTLEAGGRYESIDYDIFNRLYNSFTGNILTSGGLDGNLLTLYDNAVSTSGALLETKRSYRFFNYTGSVAYDVASNFSVYARYTSGKKAADFGTIAGINTVATIATQFPAPQVIRQFEMGLKFHQHGLDLQFFPFYSQLSNVATVQTFTYTAGAQKGQFYSPPPIPGTIKTYGVEISATGEIVETLTGHAQITLQNPRSSGFTTYAQGAKGDGTDDVKNIVPEGDADNNPKIIIRAGLDWKPVPEVTLFGEFNYIGKRAANLNNAFYLPAYNTTDVGGTWNINKMFKLQLNVTNVFNQSGVLSWSRSGGFLDSLDRQGVTKPNPAAATHPASDYSPTAVYPIVNVQARAFFLTLGAKF